MTEPTLIAFDQVYKSYGAVEAVYDLSFEVEPQEIIALLGPSGCGKTTTLRLIAGLEKPDNGTIVLNGRKVAASGTWIPPESRRIGMVFQDYALFPHLDVTSNVVFGLNGQRQERKKRAGEMLELVGLKGYGDRMPHMLSGGQQQRVALARALAPRPSIMLLDEPFSNLDAALRAQVRREVQSILRETGTTTLFVTHDQEEALSLSDRIGVIFEGRLHQLGTPEQLYNNPVNPHVARFLGEANLIPAEAEGSRARSALGEVRLRTPTRGPVQLLIRPELIHLHPADEGVPAEVLWREYYGHTQRIGLRLSDGTELIARTDAQVMHEPGERLRVNVYAPLVAYGL